MYVDKQEPSSIFIICLSVTIFYVKSLKFNKYVFFLISNTHKEDGYTLPIFIGLYILCENLLPRVVIRGPFGMP